jgi:hypothetical protein
MSLLIASGERNFDALLRAVCEQADGKAALAQ